MISTTELHYRVWAQAEDRVDRYLWGKVVCYLLYGLCGGLMVGVSLYWLLLAPFIALVLRHCDVQHRRALIVIRKMISRPGSW